MKITIRIVLVACLLGYIASVGCSSNGTPSGTGTAGNTGSTSSTAASGTGAAGGSAPHPTSFGSPTGISCTKLLSDIPNSMWESSVAYDPRSKQVIRHGGHIWGAYAQSRFTFLYRTEDKTFTHSHAPSPGPRQCLVDAAFIASVERTAYVNGGSQHGTIPYGSIQANYTKIDIGDSVGPFLYDGVSDTWEDARTFPAQWTRKNHMQVAWDGSTDQMIGLYGNAVTLYSGHQNRVTSRTIPDALMLRSGYAIAADPFHGKLVVFGGSSGGNWQQSGGDQAALYDTMVKADTWIYDPAADTWTDVTSAISPPRGIPLLDMVKLPMVWHAASGRMILHQVPVTTCDKDYASWKDAEFWSFDVEKAAWEKLPVTGDVPPMTGMMAYDTDRDEIVMLGGGRDGDQDRPNLSRELYVCKVELDGAPRPTRPLDVQITVSTAEVKLSWDAAIGPVDIYRASTKGSPAPFEKVKSAAAGGSYTEPVDTDGHAYRVVSESAGQASNAVFSEPHRPSGMVASVESATDVKLAWKAVSGLTYRVHRARGNELGGGGKVLSTVSGGSFEDTTDDLTDGTLRFYWVTALNAAGLESGPSPYATSMPDRPESISTAVMPSGKVHVSWKWSNGTTLRGFRVYHINHHMNTAVCPDDVADAWWHSFTPVNATPTTATDLVFTPPPGEETLHHYFYVRAVNVLEQEGYFTDLSSATDFRFANEPDAPNLGGPQASCDN
ncbi:Hypothetical protein A7982_04689 [Minicystis rosea]|nr:Hypothetical protein A7982_04689 [Minicystis rosea]